jgi:hypothetical protein
MTKRFIGLVALLFLIAGCHTSHRETPMPPVNTMAPAKRVETAGTETSPAYQIKEWDLMLETERFDEASARLKTLIRQFNGIITSENQNAFQRQRHLEILCRIPSARVDTFVSRIRHDPYWQVISASLRVQDVTASYTDTEVKLKHLRALEQRYTELLSQARSVEEILKVERELNRVRTEIEQLEKRQKNLRNRIDYTRVHILLRESGRHLQPSFGHQLKTAFIDGWELFKGFLLLLVRLWLILLSLVVVWLLWRYYQRKRRT